MGDDNAADFVDMKQARQKKDSSSLGVPKLQSCGDCQDQERGVGKHKNDEDIDFITAVRIDDVELGRSSSKR